MYAAIILVYMTSPTEIAGGIIIISVSFSDTSFEANYMSPGSLLMLRQFDVISRCVKYNSR